MSLKQRVVWGITASVGGFGIKTLLNLAIIPLIITHMGASHYGVYILLVAMIDMVSDLANGLTSALTLQLGQSYTPTANPTHLTQLRTGLWVHTVVAGLIFIVGMAATPLLLSTIKWPGDLVESVPYLVALAFAEGCIYLFSGFFRAGLSAHTRLGVAHSIDMGQAIISNIGIAILLLWFKAPLPVLISLRCAIALASMLFLAWISRHAWGQQTDWRPSQLKKTELKQFWDISWITTANMLLMLISCRMDGLIIGSFLSITAVATYGIVQRIYGQAVFLGVRIAGVVLPIFNRLTAEGQTAQIRTFFLRASQGLFFVAGFLVIWLTWFFPPLFQLLSDGKLDLALTLPVLWVLVPYALIIISTFPADSYLYSQNQYRQVFIWTSQSSVANLIISLVAVQHIGIAGAALGTLVSVLADRLCRSMPKACAMQGIPLKEYAAVVYGRNILSLLVAAVVMWATRQLVITGHPLAQFFICGGTAFVSGGLLWASQNLLPQERDQLINRIKGVLQKTRTNAAT